MFFFINNFPGNVPVVDLLGRQSFSSPSPIPPYQSNISDEAIPSLPNNFSLFIVFREIPITNFRLVSIYKREFSTSDDISYSLQNSTNFHEVPSTNTSNFTFNGQSGFTFESSLTIGSDVNVIYNSDYESVWQDIALHEVFLPPTVTSINQSKLILTVENGVLTSCLNGEYLSKEITLWNASDTDQVLLIFSEEFYLPFIQVSSKI